jgi:type II secretory pathway component GspD/PulD (secretin)
VLHAGRKYCFLILYLTWSSLYGQPIAESELKLSANFENTPLPEAFSALQKQYPIWFSYDYDLLNRETITLRFENYSLEKTLREMLRGKGLKYEIQAQKYILIKKSGNSDVHPDSLPELPQTPV